MLRKFAAVAGITVGTVSLLAASVVHALGMGDIRPGSGLNQPLNAEIELVSLRGVSPDEIRATVASLEEFDKAGIERVYALNDLKMVVQSAPNGEAIIKLRTKDAVREPFLNFIVELNWPNGRLLREYTLLLDPPVFADEAPVVMARPKPQAPVTTSGTVDTTPVQSEMPVQSTERAPSSSSAVSNTMAGSDSYGPVSSNDTLWSIASRVRPNDSVTVQQTLVAIFKANPQAFNNNNVNQMKQGETLRIPSADEIAAIPHRRALAEFVGAGAVVETARRGSSDAGSSAGSGRLTLAAPPEKYSTGKGGASREAAEVLNQENEALRGQLGKLVDKTQKLEKLVQLKDQQLSEVTGKPIPKTTMPADTSPSTSTTTPVTETTTAESPEVVGMAQEATPPEPVVEKPKDKPKKKPTTPTKPKETSFLEGLLGENAMIILLAILGGVAVLIGFLIWKRKQVADENFHESLLPLDSDDSSGNMRMDDEFDLPEVGEDFLAPPPAPVADSVATPQETVADPLGESDIYIAYGKYEQAEQLLLRALQDQPNRHELRLKLLECYAEMQEQNKFRDQVAMFQDAIDSDPQLAKQVEKLQQRAWPTDRFSNQTAPTPLPSADDIFGSVGVGAGSNTKTKAAEPAATTWAPARKENVAADFDNEGEFALDLDADLSNVSKDAEPALTLEPDADDSEFSFDLEDNSSLNSTAASDWQPESEPSPVRATADDSFSLDDMDADLPGGDELGMGDIDEIATKLDLARAYIEMHEVDGAKEILQEVLAEGNAQQKQEAQALLGKL
ncbi:FimV family protein [Permianibacter sp. IMCC34836]|uniref:FimV family protein n=1 Tax=Permianibacter fluminis TaxID=2738515 RepID=UPI001556ABD0|nr:FimV family protein [Permianibacter fluminis]NQD37530.1 FimV family protein [Permianibacter fluminis]